MGLVKIELNKVDIDRLARALQSVNEVRFNAVVKKNVTELLNAARNGGTPIDTGELRKSSGIYGDEMGYTVDYAPHVEYGHRTIDGGWVSGKHFLKANVDSQAFIYYQDLKNAIKKGEVMYKQIGLTDLISAIQKKIEDHTGTKCYDAVTKNAPSPFYFAEIIGKRPAHSKTMWRDVFTVWIHAVAEPGESSVRIYSLIQELEEALTEDIELPEGFDLIMQTNNGVQTIKTDETNEKHAVLAYEFMICYGFKCKI